jgi:hypothetical protein
MQFIYFLLIGIIPSLFKRKRLSRHEHKSVTDTGYLIMNQMAT